MKEKKNNHVYIRLVWKGKYLSLNTQEEKMQVGTVTFPISLSLSLCAFCACVCVINNLNRNSKPNQVGNSGS